MPRKKKNTVSIKPLCDKVVVNENGLAVRPSEACHIYGVFAKVIFCREDGWTLGAPAELERVAFGTWADKWIGFARWPLYEKQGIAAYRIPAEK